MQEISFLSINVKLPPRTIHRCAFKNLNLMGERDNADNTQRLPLRAVQAAFLLAV